MKVSRRFLRNPTAMIGTVLLLAITFAVFLLPPLLPHDPGKINPRDKYQAPSAQHWLGTDQLGRDLLSRALVGGRVSLMVGLAAVTFGGLIGVTAGMVAGYYGGWLDTVVMRLADVQLSIPTVLLAILLMATTGASLTNLVVVMAVTGWVVFARTTRGTVLLLKESLYVEAVRALGASDPAIIFRHILRNGWTPVLVIATQRVSQMILLEASLSFLGIGVPPSVPTWGSMVREGRLMLEHAWWVPVTPGILLALTVLAINFVGDGLRDVLDPRLRST
jgi:peptide/nickel transport system permease protein